MDNKKELFRKKSLDRISSPEELNDFLHVTNPPMWMILSAIIILLAGFLVWSFVGNLQTTVKADAVVKDGMVTITLSDGYEGNIDVGMDVNIGAASSKIETVSSDASGRITAGGRFDIPDGEYEADIITENLTPISFLFN
ncbi:MAG: hypothetical protein K5888_10895 [Lachnospiraceae bacterium]|nr:hypothetical protein [Lachnospiraceae bacterium]